MHRPAIRLKTAAVLAATLLLVVNASPARANPQVYQKALRATGWVIIPRVGNSAAGTCWLVDRDNRLAITCRHITRDAEEVLVYFPVYEKDEVVADAHFYLHNRQGLRGKVVASDKLRDLALIQLEAVPDGVVALPLAAASSRPGEFVHSIGNSGLGERLDRGSLWWYTLGSVRQVYRQRHKTEDGKERVVRVVETQSPVNKGDSGGPVLNEKAEVVGVTDSYDADERLVSQNIDVLEIKRFLAEFRARGKDDGRPILPVALEATHNVAGTWDFTATHKKAHQALNGTGRFHPDGTFQLTSPKRTLTGRYAYLNGVLWLILDEATATADLAWTGRNHFEFTSADSEMVFNRAKPAAAQ